MSQLVNFHNAGNWRMALPAGVPGKGRGMPSPCAANGALATPGETHLPRHAIGFHTGSSCGIAGARGTNPANQHAAIPSLAVRLFPSGVLLRHHLDASVGSG